MMETIGKYTVMFAVAALLNALAYFMKSDYLTDFFASNAIVLASAIFAIHASSVGILMSQLEILKQRVYYNFSSTISEIRKSFKEALLWLMAIITSAIIIKGLSNNDCPLFDIIYIKEFLSTCIVFSVIALIVIVIDTVNAILICLEYSQN